MACSDDRALGRIPAHGSNCGTLCRTAGFRGVSFASVSPLVALQRVLVFAGLVVFARVVVFALVMQALLRRRVPSEGI